MLATLKKAFLKAFWHTHTDSGVAGVTEDGLVLAFVQSIYSVSKCVLCTPSAHFLAPNKNPAFVKVKYYIILRVMLN